MPVEIITCAPRRAVLGSVTAAVGREGGSACAHIPDTGEEIRRGWLQIITAVGTVAKKGVNLGRHKLSVAVDDRIALPAGVGLEFRQA